MPITNETIHNAIALLVEKQPETAMDAAGLLLTMPGGADLLQASVADVAKVLTVNDVLKIAHEQSK